MNLKDSKRSKFSYLQQQNQKQRLLNQYNSLNSSPHTKYQYDESSNNKQNIIKDYKNSYIPSQNININMNSHMNLKQTHKQRKRHELSNEKYEPYNDKNKYSNSNRFSTFAKKMGQVEFSPYSNENILNLSTNKNIDNLLINQYDEQFKLVKKQLTQYQYQNQLLRQKAKYLQTENQQFNAKIIAKDDQIAYFQRLTSNLQIQRIHLDTLVSEMEEQIKILLIKNSMLEEQILIKSEELIYFNNLEIQTQETKKRRKSLDLTIYPRNKDRPNLNQEQSAKNRQNSFKKRSMYVGKLMNMNSFNMAKRNMNQKSLNLQDHVQNNNLLSKSSQHQKFLNLIQSIRTMYLKINNKPANDLKQLWKWLKNIAHENQIIKTLKQMKKSLISMLGDLQSRSEKYELSFMEREWLKILMRIVDLLFNQQRD